MYLAIYIGGCQRGRIVGSSSNRPECDPPANPHCLCSSEQVYQPSLRVNANRITSTASAFVEINVQIYCGSAENRKVDSDSCCMFARTAVYGYHRIGLGPDSPIRRHKFLKMYRP